MKYDEVQAWGSHRRRAGRRPPDSTIARLLECVGEDDRRRGAPAPISTTVLFCPPHIELAVDLVISEFGKIYKGSPVGKSVAATSNSSRREGAEDLLLREQLKVASKVEQLFEEELKLVKLDRPSLLVTIGGSGGPLLHTASRHFTSLSVLRCARLLRNSLLCGRGSNGSILDLTFFTLNRYLTASPAFFPPKKKSSL